MKKTDHDKADAEPNAPKISDLPPKLQDGQHITETEGYKAGMKLLQLVFQDDRDEITKQALMHADTLQEGLKYLKSQGYDLMHQIKENAQFLDQNDDQKLKILNDFEQALTDKPKSAEHEESLLKDLFKQGISNQMYLEQRKKERAKKLEARRQQMLKEKESADEFRKQRQQKLEEQPDFGLLSGVNEFMEQHLKD